MTDEEDAEYKLAIEASKHQEEEDRKRRAAREGALDDDDDLAKAIKLSKEEEERRRRELEEQNAMSLFDDEPSQSSQPQYTGFNQGYQQGTAVDFFANPVDQQSQLQPQQTAYTNNAYAQFQQPTGYQNGYSNGFGQQGMFDPYGQQQQQQQQQLQPQQTFQPQPTGYNPYAQQQPQQPQFQTPQIQEPTLQPGSNNPWAGNSMQAGALRPMPTGSNNPFAQQQQSSSSLSTSPFNRPSSAFRAPTLGSLPEQKTLSAFSSTQQQQPNLQQLQYQQQLQQQQQQQPQREVSEHEAKLNALLATGDGMDTFGNTGNLRIPAQHTAPGTFVNSAGAGLTKINAEATGNNPFLRQQFTGMPTVSYGGQQMPAATGPAGMGMGGFGGAGFGGQQQQQQQYLQPQQTNNPFASAGGQQRQQQQGQGDLIQF